MSIVVKNLSYTYNPGTPFEKQALKNLSLTVEKGEFLCMVGHTGSGKSTFIQHLNGLIRLQSGEITVEGISLNVKKPDYKTLRSKVGMVFQYPEYQLFADTVEKDVAFGPKNMKLSEEETAKRVPEALRLVGLDPVKFADKSPFELSGGEKRRVAIAGVLAMRPEILILDEPTAGLDPRGKKEILTLIKGLNEENEMTILMVNHDMNEASEYADRIAVMYEGELYRCDVPTKMFDDGEFLARVGLEMPQMAILRNKLRERGFSVDDDCLTVDRMFDCIMKLRRNK